MGKIFFKVSSFNLITLSTVYAVGCEINVSKDVSNYTMKETKDFDLNYFTKDQFQILANNKISEDKRLNSYEIELRKQIKNQIYDTIFEKIMGIKIPACDEEKAMKELNFQIIEVEFELINKNQQMQVTVKVNEWERIERFFKAIAFPNSTHKLIKGAAQFGLDNVKKYYEHIKGNQVKFNVEYGDERFYISIEEVKTILEEDNKLNLNKYQFYVQLDPLHIKSDIKEQLNYYLKQLLKNQHEVQVNVVDYKDRDTFKHKLTNDLVDRAIDLNRINLEFNQPYQTLVKITDKNNYVQYVPIKFQVKDIDFLIKDIKKLDFNSLVPDKNWILNLESEAKEYINKTFEETKAMRTYVTVLDEQKRTV